jgi:alkanesulfonate monooxygenase SsuD/methylene tetrahydromethanopterin reductase-like flavin-dependent oxidoreductase (luciferase family)
MTSRIKLGAAAHLLPYHNPVDLAHRLMWLDHMTGGRYIAGVAPGAFPTDAQLFDTGDNNVEMMRESLDIILAIWTREGPFRIEGKYWTVDMPAYSERWHGPHLKPLQKPHPPLAIVGMQPASPSLSEAGRRGFNPISQMLSSETLEQHWDTYSTSVIASGGTPDRRNWRVVRDIFVADTDEDAVRHVVDGAMGRLWREHNLPTFKQLGLAKLMSSVPEDELTVDYLARNFWIVGSPDTVVDKLTALQEETGGFETLLSLTYDYSDDPRAYQHSFELLGRNVTPRVSGLGPQTALAGAVSSPTERT